MYLLSIFKSCLFKPRLLFTSNLFRVLTIIKIFFICFQFYIAKKWTIFFPSIFLVQTKNDEKDSFEKDIKIVMLREEKLEVTHFELKKFYLLTYYYIITLKINILIRKFMGRFFSIFLALSLLLHILFYSNALHFFSNYI